MKKNNPLKDFTYIRIYKSLKNYQSFSFEMHRDYYFFKGKRTYKDVKYNHKDFSFRLCRTIKDEK